MSVMQSNTSEILREPELHGDDLAVASWCYFFISTSC